MSGLAVVWEGSEERQYAVRTFITKKTITSYSIDFVMTWNTMAHLKVSEHPTSLVHVYVPSVHTECTGGVQK